MQEAECVYTDLDVGATPNALMFITRVTASGFSRTRALERVEHGFCCTTKKSPAGLLGSLGPSLSIVIAHTKVNHAGLRYEGGP